MTCDSIVTFWSSLNEILYGYTVSVPPDEILRLESLTQNFFSRTYDYSISRPFD